MRNWRTWWLRARPLAGAVVLIVAGAMQASQPERRIVRVRAERFAFTPSEIVMKVGEEIDIRIKSDDTAHGFHIVGGDIDITIPKRGQGETSVIFKGEKAGRYEFECSRMCGAGHSFMRGVIAVKEARPPDAGIQTRRSQGDKQ